MIEAWFDGVCEPKNPGGYAAYGIHILRNNDILLSVGRFVGNGKGISNNVAEYSGFIEILNTLLGVSSQDEPLIIRGDSKLVIEQMQGKWRIKQGFYIPLALKAKKLVKKFKRLTLIWIPREENEICDKLAKDVLRNMNIKFRIQPE